MGMWIEFWTWQIGAGGGWGPEVGIHSYHILSRIPSAFRFGMKNSLGSN